MARQRLAFDILLLIMEISPLPTAAKMTRTCHTLREGGARFLLDGGVSLTTGDNIISFVQFLYANAVNRFQHLRTLELACGEIPPPAVDALLGLISHPLLALDSLTLQEADSLLKSTLALSSSSDVVHDLEQPPLIAAIAGLTTIRHLAVHGYCGCRACSIIKTMRSPLKTISVNFAPLGRSVQNRNPVVLLANHSDTLEEISGSHFAMPPEPDLHGAVYPLVRTINASFDSILPPQTLAYIIAFPNLTHLSLTAAVGTSGPGSRGSSRLERAIQRRLWNREIQERHTPRQTWNNLEELEGSVADILALGVSCHVPKLRLTGAVLSEPQEYEHVKTILGDTRPAGLAITIAGASTFGDTMGPVLRDPSAGQLRALEVELLFSPSEGDVDVQTVLNKVATTLALLPLHHVALTLNYGLLTAQEELYRPRDGWFCPVERDVEGLDLVATRMLFRAAIPSLVTDIVVRL